MIEILELPIPPTLNELINTCRSNRYKAASEKKKWTRLIAELAVDKTSFPDIVWMSFTWFVPNKRFDPDNLAASKKYILDGLVVANMLKGDSLSIIQSPVIDRFIIDANKRVIVEIWDENDVPTIVKALSHGIRKADELCQPMSTIAHAEGQCAQQCRSLIS